MKYFLQRDGRTFGPYSYEDLKRYQAENRIGPNDLVRQEDSQQWEPWQQVLNPQAAAPAADPAPSAGFGGYSSTPEQPQSGGFGQAPAAQGGFGQAAPQSGGFGDSAHSQGGFGQPPAQSGGFGQAPVQQGGFGQPPAQQGGFGQPPAQQGGFGGGFGESAPQQQGFGGGGFGQGAAAGFGSGFGSQPAPQGGYGAPGGGYGGGGAVGPMPPDMQWWMVLLIGMVTCGIFIIFWIYKQVQFVKRIDPSTQAGTFYKYALLLYVGGYILAIVGAFAAAAMGSELAMIIPMLGQLVVLGGAVCLILAAFKMRASIHNYYTTVEPMGIDLMDTTGAVLTFFFSVYFFQYHFANIAARKKAMGHPAV